MKKCTAALDQLKKHIGVADFSSEQKLEMYNEIEIIDGYSDQDSEITENEILSNNVEDEILSDDGKVSILDPNKNHINLSQKVSI